MAADAARLERDALLAAAAEFGALAKAYAAASDSDLAADRAAADVVRQLVASLAAFADKRRTDDEARARVAIASGLRRIYLRVRGSESGETEAPPSRRTWHEGAWQTDDERRSVITRMITRWLPSIPPDDAAAADLSADEIEARGGPGAAVDSVIATLFAEPRRESAGLRGATVFGLPLDY